MPGLPAAYLDQFSEPGGYLNFASIGPPSKRVTEAVSALTADLPGAGSRSSSLVLSTLAAAREATARLFAVPAERAAVVTSTSEALFHVALGLRGGNVVIPEGEFAANVYPWLRARDAGLVDEVRRVPLRDGRLEPGEVAKVVDARTRVVAVSLVSFATGFRVDPAGLRAAAGDALVVLDAIQAAGAIPVGLGDADLVVAEARKWLRGSFGAAALAVSERLLDRVEPTLTGWTGVEDFLDFAIPEPHRPRADAGRFAMGGAPVLSAAALAAAVEVMDLGGIERIAQVVVDRARRLEATLRRIGATVRAPWRSDDERGGIVTFRMSKEESVATVARLADAGFVVSDRAGWVRVAVHATTRPEVIDELGAVLEGRSSRFSPSGPM